MVVWVRADGEIIKERLTVTQREGHLLKEPPGMYLAMKKDLRACYEADIEFKNSEPPDVAAEKLTRLVKERLM